MQSRKRVALVAILSLVLGIGVGTGGALLFSGRLIANVLLEMKRTELAKSSDATGDASTSEAASTAIWALNRHLNLIGELGRIGYPQHELDVEAVIAHARLARIWDSLKNAEKRSEHACLGLEIAHSCDSPGLQKMTSEKDFMVFAHGLDDPAKRPTGYKWGG